MDMNMICSAPLTRSSLCLNHCFLAMSIGMIAKLSAKPLQKSSRVFAKKFCKCCAIVANMSKVNNEHYKCVYSEIEHLCLFEVVLKIEKRALVVLMFMDV